jgi:hypothetical protein
MPARTCAQQVRGWFAMETGGAFLSLLGMTKNAPETTPRLLLVMAGATAIGLLLIIGFLNVAEWWLVPVTVGAVIVGCALVLAAFLHTLSDEGEDENEEVTETEQHIVATPAPSHAARRRSGYKPSLSHQTRSRV